MYSVCPACHKEQSVSAVSLQLNNGHVSCQSCQLHFDAKLHRVDPVREKHLKLARKERDSLIQRQRVDENKRQLRANLASSFENKQAEKSEEGISSALHQPVSDFFAELTKTMKTASERVVEMKQYSQSQHDREVGYEQFHTTIEASNNRESNQQVRRRLGGSIQRKTAGSDIAISNTYSKADSYKGGDDMLEDKMVEKLKRERLLILKAKLQLELEQEKLQLELEKEKLALEKEKVALEKQKFRMQREVSSGAESLNSANNGHNVVGDILPRTHTAINDGQPEAGSAMQSEETIKLELTPIEPQKVFQRQLRRK